MNYTECWRKICYCLLWPPGPNKSIKCASALVILILLWKPSPIALQDCWWYSLHIIIGCKEGNKTLKCVHKMKLWNCSKHTHIIQCLLKPIQKSRQSHLLPTLNKKGDTNSKSMSEKVGLSSIDLDRRVVVVFLLKKWLWEVRKILYCCSYTGFILVMDP